MLHELQTMENEVYQSRLREKERELLQLQAQINPHFLFNTLETIESYSMKNNGQAVGDMVQSVAKMMRYSVRNDGGWAPIKDEISYIHHFLNIHYYRHGTKVSVYIQMDSACNDIRIMKLSIQPFIENAIKYGWSPSMTTKEFALSVTIHTDENYLRINIRDTGIGMPEDIWDKLCEMIENKGDSADTFFRQHTGISNVCRRFFLAYGDDTSIRIHSVPGSGTTVSLCIPL
ncbi:putative sensor-like histidine kinase [compost metagenome]